MSNNGIPPLNDWQADNYPVIYDEGDETLKYVKTGTKHDINRVLLFVATNPGDSFAEFSTAFGSSSLFVEIRVYP